METTIPEHMLLDLFMREIYSIALSDIGEEQMHYSSWYYTNQEVWKYYFDRGYSPIEAYASDVASVETSDLLSVSRVENCK